MRQDLIDLLNKYLLSQATLHDCYEWAAGVDWDDPAYQLDTALVREIGTLELLAIESLEGLREESEFRNAAKRAVESLLNISEFQWDMAQAGPPIVIVASSRTEVTATTIDPAPHIGDVTYRVAQSFA